MKRIDTVIKTDNPNDIITIIPIDRDFIKKAREKLKDKIKMPNTYIVEV